jgi:hypothetical protein
VGNSRQVLTVRIHEHVPFQTKPQPPEGQTRAKKAIFRAYGKFLTDTDTKTPEKPDKRAIER